MKQAESWKASLLGAAQVALLSVLFAVPVRAYETKVFDLPVGTNVNSLSPAPDGKVWFTALKPGVLGILDPSTGKVRFVQLGKDSAPHDVIAGKDGNAWITDAGQNAIVRVNTKTDELKVWPLPQGLGRASLNGAVFDRDGVLWFTGAGSNGEYGRLDVATGEVRVWRPPQGRYTFGITVTPDNEVWYVSVVPSYIAHIDRATGESKVVETPYPGAEPHRLRSDSKGSIWIDEWTSGSLMRYMPKNGEWKIWLLPGDKPPHASGVFVDDRDIVWVVQRGANATYAFDSATEKFIAAIPGSKPDAGARILGRAGELWLAEASIGRLVRVKTNTVKAGAR